MRIKNEFASENFNEYEFAILCFLSNLEGINNEVYVSTNIIIKNLTIHSGYTRYELENINTAFNKLIERGYIEIIETDKSGFYINIQKIKPTESDFYFTLNDNEMSQIIQYKSRNRFYTLKVFAIILSNFASNISATVGNLTKKRVICQMPQNFLAYKADCSEVTLIRHIKILEELQLLYVLRDYSNIGGTKGYKRNNNIYCRYEDRAFAISYASNSRGHLMNKKKHEEINAKRSATQKKNYQTKKAEETTMEDLKRYVRENDDADFIPRDINSMLDALSDHMM